MARPSPRPRRWRRDVQLGEITLKGVAPYGGPEAQHRDAVRSCPSEQHRRVTGGQHAPDPLGQPVGPRRRLVELAVEIVQELTDRLGIGRARNANGQVRRSFLSCTDLRTVSHAQVLPQADSTARAHPRSRDLTGAAMSSGRPEPPRTGPTQAFRSRAS
jgi:hypothetical protein